MSFEYKGTKALLILQIIILIIITSANLSSQTPRYSPVETEQKFNSAFAIIRNFYVDTVNEPKLVEAAIRQVLKELDPHSVYLSKKELQEANEPLEGNFEGVGIQFNILNDTINVVATIPGGPSEKLGILAGDKIIKINDEDAFGKKVNNSFVMKRLRGEKGSKVKVTMFRRGSKGLIDFDIIRDKIPLNSIDATYMAAPGVGLIKLNRFSRTSITEFRESLSKLKSEGMTSLILDLRDNTGGYLDIAVELGDEFLDDAKIIVYTEGMYSPRQDYSARYTGSFEKGKLAILINENSASASEIVSGAIQDWDRGIIIGRRSFGKGLVQRPFNLPDGSAIRLTTARYHTPTGRCIQKSYKEGTEKYYKDLMNRYKHKEYINPDSIKFPDSLKFQTKINRRTVYSGGGIMPDIFIPLDTSFTSDYLVKLYSKNVVGQFSLQYVNDNREKLKSKFQSVKDYANSFKVTDEMLNKLIEFAENLGIKRDEKGFNTSKEMISLSVRALIADNLWRRDAFFEIYYSTDTTVKKAIDMLKGDELKKMKMQY